MNFWRQLRWRIVGAQMVIVVVGVVIVLLMAFLITQYFVPADVQSGLEQLAVADGVAEVQQRKQALLDAFRGSVLTAVSVAAAGAIVAGMVTSLLLARQILRPLNEIAAGSRRIARGRYDERVAVPGSDELRELASSFNQMAQALEEVEQTRVTMIGNVSHELRTPLSGLKGYLEGLLDGLFPKNEETFALMAHEVNRLHRLVDDLQVLSRVEAGQISLELETFDLVVLVDQVEAQLRPQLVAKELDFCVTREEMGKMYVVADPGRVTQILVNLIGNAIRHTPERGRITVCLRDETRHVRVDVQDNGEGIPPEQLPYLFERFYRVDRSRARKSGGTGIGLTISRHLVWAMGGDLTAHSDGLGQGATFSFTLPAVPGPAPAS